ncbi:uncharacterized protein [Nicotiana tomentosiformis]|uniref:uncharacterized protein n=1 Tax=Nicotiana tomentosiformis TaxID=4098 RepID=UPI00388C44B1
MYTVYCDALHVGLGCVLMQDGRVIVYASRKVNMVADDLSRKVESMGSLSMDVQALADRFVRLDISEPSKVLAYVVVQSSLFEHINICQYNDTHLLVLKDTVLRGGAKEVVIGDNGVLRL